MTAGYTCHVTINIEVVHAPKQIADVWTKVVRTLRRKGIMALWVREPTKAGGIHYHLLLRNEIGEKELAKVIDGAMPNFKVQTAKRVRKGWHAKYQRIKPDEEWQILHYVSKAKIAGYRGGKPVDDFYANKRLLFKAGLKIKKYGEIGDFWLRPKKKLWQEIIDIEKRIGEGLEKPNVKRLAEYVYDLIGGYISLKDIERSFGHDADGPAVQHWIESLLAGEWAEDHAAEDG
jgi:hypothetical protein